MLPFRRPCKLQIEFEGNSAFKGWQLREGIARQIQSIEEFGLDDANVYDAVFFLESFYRRHGYSQAEVTSNVLGPWRLRLTVNEGPLTTGRRHHVHRQSRLRYGHADELSPWPYP